MIYIPSYKRASDCKTAKLFSKATICCHKFEAEEYERYNDNKLMVMPDDISGKGMAVIRNYILDHAKENRFVMMDDDILGFGYHEKAEKNEYTESKFYSFIVNAFVMMEEMGTVLWGVNLLEDKQAYREFAPIGLSNVVLGPCLGIKKCDIRFDEELGLKEDYDYSIQVLNRYRKILKFNKVYYRTKHIQGKGGCVAYRTSDKEIEQRGKFQKKWGSRIVKFKKGDINPVIIIPI